MPDAILHAATRVIRRTTIDADHKIGSDEIKQPLPEPIPADFAKVRYRLLADGSYAAATQAEVTESNFGPIRPELQAIVDALDDILNDPSPVVTPAKLKTLCQRLRVIYGRRPIVT